MAANFQITAAARNAACNAIVDLLDAGVGSAKINIYSGTQPATADTALSGNTLLATITCSATAFGSASSGVATLAGTPLSTTAVATGTATFFRATTGSDVAVFDGSVGTASADLILNTTALTSGNTVQITSTSTVTVPAH